MIFFIVTIISAILSTQVACDDMCVQYVQKQPPEMFFKKGVLKNFANLTPVLESLFNKNGGLGARNFIKKSVKNRCFPVKLAKILRTPILKNICGRLLIK